jgi:hypothetical protein
MHCRGAGPAAVVDSHHYRHRPPQGRRGNRPRRATDAPTVARVPFVGQHVTIRIISHRRECHRRTGRCFTRSIDPNHRRSVSLDAKGHPHIDPLVPPGGSARDSC